jgi:hypothetical protein
LFPTLAWPQDQTAQISSPNWQATFSTGAAAVSPPATPTDICVISGNATNNVRVTHVDLSSTQTTAGVNVFYLVKRSTLDTTGTSSTLTDVPHDSKYGAGLAVVKTYTANPGSLGTTVGTIRAIHLLSPAPGGANFQPQQWVFDQDQQSQAIILHANESLAINFAGAALPTGLSVNCNFEWTEY